VRRFLAEPVFRVGDALFDWTDVRMAAALWGEWPALVARARAGLLATLAEDGATALDDATLEEAANAFRWAHDLTTAARMDAWLARWHLDADEWFAWLVRSTLPGPPATADTPPADDARAPGLDDAIHAEAVCSGAWDAWARRLAARAAVAARQEADRTAPPARRDDAALAALAARLVAEGVVDEAGLPLVDRIFRLVRLEAAVALFARAVATPAAIAARVAARRHDWTRLACRTLLLTDADAAAAVVRAVHETGAPLDAHADPTDAPLRSEAIFLRDLDPAVQLRLVGAPSGAVVGPLPLGGGFAVVEIAGLYRPDPSDPTIARLATDELVAEGVAAEVDARVVWIAPD
jgi:hypothetical protein